MTVPLMHKLWNKHEEQDETDGEGEEEGCHFGAYRNISQNIVASQRLRPGEELCLGLLFKRLEGYDAEGNKAADMPEDFKSVVLTHVERRATVLVYRCNVICVGTSSLTDLVNTYGHFHPTLDSCKNTPENIHAELALVRNGALDPGKAQRTLNYEVNFDADGKLCSARRIETLPTEAELAAMAEKAKGGRKRKRGLDTAATPKPKRVRKFQEQTSPMIMANV